MGLRENAEAARVQRLEEKAAQKRREEEARRQREIQRREKSEELAEDLADEIGFGIAEFAWIDEPMPEGYSKLTTLFVKSDDGVWLKYSMTRKFVHGPVESRFHVVDKCPSCPAWVERGGFATTMSDIGEQLAKPSRVPYHHERTHGAPVPA